MFIIIRSVLIIIAYIFKGGKEGGGVSETSSQTIILHFS